MICRPSFKPEYAVAIRDVELPKSGKPADDPFGKLEYRQVLEVATATEQIWHWSQQGDGKLDLRDAQVVCKSAEVSNEFSEEIVNSWKAVLRLTRYADDPDGGLDGTSYDFYAAGYFGATWSPEYTNAALPFSLVNLAHKLKAIVESPAEKRAPLIQEASKMAAALKAAADAEHKRLASISAPAK